MFTGFWRYFAKSDHSQSKSYHHQSKSYLTLLDILCQIYHNFSDNSSALADMYQPTVTPIKLAVKVMKSLVANMATTQTTTKFEDIADNTLSCDLMLSFRGNINLNFNKSFKENQ